MACELHLGQADGGFEWSYQKAFNTLRKTECLAGLFFEADGDGDLDLYLAMGGYESAEDSPLLQDVLLLNDGRGQFFAAPAGRLPAFPTSSSVVTAADVDRDGDLDLFVGGRVIPGKYPTAPSSRLLINDGRAGFSDGTARLAPVLTTAGMVTGGCWSDVDGDGWPDLMITTEWGPVKCLVNRIDENKGFVDETETRGLKRWLGWWNSILPMDTDQDGDMDFIVGNTGLGSKYKASTKKPAVLFYGAFDEGKGKQIIEAAFKDGRFVPVRGLSCSSSRMDWISKQFR